MALNFKEIFNGESGLSVRNKLNEMLREIIEGNIGIKNLWSSVSNNEQKITNIENSVTNIDNQIKEVENNCIDYTNKKIEELPLDEFIPKSQKGRANGVSTLNSEGKVPLEQLPPIGGEVDTSNLVELVSDILIPGAPFISDYASGKYFQKIATFPVGSLLMLNTYSGAYGLLDQSTIWVNSFQTGTSILDLLGHDYRAKNNGDGTATLYIPTRTHSSQPHKDYHFQYLRLVGCNKDTITWHTNVEVERIENPTTLSKSARVMQVPSLSRDDSRVFNISNRSGSLTLQDCNDFIGSFNDSLTDNVRVRIQYSEEGKSYRFTFSKDVNGIEFYNANGVVYCSISEEIKAGSVVTLTSISNTLNGWISSIQRAGIEAADDSITVEWEDGVAKLKANGQRISSALLTIGVSSESEILDAIKNNSVIMLDGDYTGVYYLPCDESLEGKSLLLYRLSSDLQVAFAQRFPPYNEYFTLRKGVCYNLYCTGSDWVPINGPMVDAAKVDILNCSHSAILGDSLSVRDMRISSGGVQWFDKRSYVKKINNAGGGGVSASIYCDKAIQLSPNDVDDEKFGKIMDLPNGYYQSAYIGEGLVFDTATTIRLVNYKSKPLILTKEEYDNLTERINGKLYYIKKEQ